MDVNEPAHEGYTGPDRRKQPPIHPIRWRLLAIWIATFTGVFGWLIITNRNAIADLKNTKASISELEKTNCDIKKSLLSTADIQEKQGHTEVAMNYRNLAALFTAVGKNCELARR